MSAGNVVTITSKENATVLALHADNTQTVKQGQLLVEMDPAVATVNLQAAEANLARRCARCGRILPHRMPAIRAKQARVTLAQARGGHEPSAEGLYDPVRVSRGTCPCPRCGGGSPGRAAAMPNGSLHQSSATIEGADIAHNPDVLSAEAQLRTAAIVYGHMRIIAPLDGVIAQRTVQAGQRLPP